MLPHLKDGFALFRANPVGESILAFLFLLACATGILLGPAAVLYLWHLNPQAPLGPMRPLLLTQRLQGTRRVATAFWIGLMIWVIALLPSLRHPLLGMPAWLLLTQPLWLALILADRFDLSLPVALRATLHFLLNAPSKALPCLLLGLLAHAGLFLFGIGILITLPIALRATLCWLDGAPAELSAAIQRAYR